MKKIASALLPAAGRGQRLGKSINKVLVNVAGKPILAHTISKFESCERINEIVVVVGRNDIEAVNRMVGRFGFKKVKAVLVGGAERQESVRIGLDHIASDIVVIHDGARPMVSADIIAASIDAAALHGGCIAAVPVVDTIKLSVDGVDVSETLDRSKLFSVQTPQTFQTSLIKSAYDEAYRSGITATDDASLMEKLGKRVVIVPGSYENIKITTPSDIDFASAKLGAGELRSGIGYDVHQLVENRKLILGGVEISFEKGLLGHSDADVLLHAVSDALLGAAGLGDIGKHFPDTDSKYKGISSLKLLSFVGKLLNDNDWQIGNVDVVLVCQKPKIAPFIPEMIGNISESLNTEPQRISIKATTTEHLGFEGRGEGISCYSTVTIRRN